LSGGSMDKTIITFQVTQDELNMLDKGAEIFAYKHGLRLNRSDYLRYLIKEQSDDQRKKY
jgi:hypothetical protein